MTKKILIFEDDIELLDAYKLKLSVDPRWVVATSPDGSDALDKIKAEKPDVIVLDLLMPQKSGLDILKEVKADPVTKHIPVVIASNVSQKVTSQQATALGAADYFIKSDVSIDEILSKCAEYL